MKQMTVKIKHKRFDTTQGIEVAVSGKNRKFYIGTKVFWVGEEFVRTLPLKACSRNGSGAIGTCPECGIEITPDNTYVVKGEVYGFKTSYPSAQHSKVGMVYRGQPKHSKKRGNMIRRKIRFIGR